MNNRTSMRLAIFLVLTASLLGGACDRRREQPTLCLLVNDGSAGTGGGAGSDACEVDPASTVEESLIDCPATVTDGSGFVLRHQLPEGVEPIGKLKIHIDTPCEGADRNIEMTHVDGVALFSGVVPPGGQCGFSVSAVMANSELRCDVLPAQPCADVKSLCDAEP